MAWKPDYVTLAEAKDYVNVADTADDTRILRWITAASRLVDKTCNRQFGKTDTVTSYTYRAIPAYNPALGLWTLPVDDIYSAAGLLVGGVAYATAGVTLLPDDAPAKGRPFEMIAFASAPALPYPGSPATVTLTTDKFGWSAVPAGGAGAVLLQVARWNSRRQSPYGIAGSPDQGGSELRLLQRLDPDAVMVLGDLVRRRRPA